MNSSILLVDDEPHVIAALKRALGDEAYEICTAESGAAGVKLCESQRFKVIISDERMPGMAGDELLAVIKERWPDTVRMMLTGHASLEAAIKAVNNGEIYRFFTKPWNDLELILSIRSAMEKYDLEAENRRLLKTVRNQSLELKLLERSYPGISRLEKDEWGNVLLPEMTERELADILAECTKDGL